MKIPFVLATSWRKPVYNPEPCKHSPAVSKGWHTHLRLYLMRLCAVCSEVLSQSNRFRWWGRHLSCQPILTRRLLGRELVASWMLLDAVEAAECERDKSD